MKSRVCRASGQAAFSASIDPGAGVVGRTRGQHRVGVMVVAEGRRAQARGVQGGVGPR